MLAKICILRRLPLVLAAIVALSSAAIAQARRFPDEVLLVSNANSPISTAIADDYAQKRHVKNRIVIKCADSALTRDKETISYGDYRDEIAGPIGQYLATHKGIDFIVLTKGVPLRVSGAPTGDGAPGPLQASVDSTLAAMDYDVIPGAVKASLTGSGTVGSAWINRYYNTSVPFTHAQFGGYLVTRLDGYTQADAMGLVSQALAAEHKRPTGKILFDIASDFGMGDKSAQPLAHPALLVTSEAAWSTWNADMLRAANLLEANGVPNEADVTKTMIGNRTDLLGYFSWGSNDNHFDGDAYESLRFAPGSFGDTAVSTSARTFLVTNFGQTTMTDLIAHGLTCCQGYVDEPLLDGTSSPTIDMSHYLVGFTMAESFYAGTPYIGWEGVVVGDPLCCPYAGEKLAAPRMAARFNAWTGGLKAETCHEGGQNLGFIESGDSSAYDDVTFGSTRHFVARVASAGPGGNIEIRLDSRDGPKIGTCPVAPTGDWQAWKTVTCDIDKKAAGTHKLFLVYTGGNGDLFNFEWFAFR